MPDAAISEIIQSARVEYCRVLLTETAGLFWILAEICILFAVRVGRRLLDAEGLSLESIQVRFEKTRAMVWGGLFLLFSAVLFGRHLFDSPLHRQLVQVAAGGDGVDLGRALNAHVSLMRAHYAVWASFVTLWVILEAGIVYNGWRGYRRLAELLAARQPPPSQMGVLPFMLVGAAAIGSFIAFGAAHASEMGADTLRRMLGEAHAANTVYRNALYLYLRLAGVVWIAVEWLAAFVLWRSFNLIAGVMRDQETRE